jgi:hypothetical protein
MVIDDTAEPVEESLFSILVATNKEKPAPADVAKLTQHLAKYPDHCARLGDLSIQTEMRLIDNNFKDSKATIISLNKYCAKMRVDMGYQAASMLERPLIDCVVLTWLRWQVCELRYEANTQGVSLAMADYWERKLSATQKRYLRAVEALARVRRLLKEPKSPAFNLLLAQQINNHR